MSWFVELSEKAENILNTIDKNAGKALNKRPNTQSSYPDDTSVFLNPPAVIVENGPSALEDSVNKADVIPSTKASRVQSRRETFTNDVDYKLDSAPVQKNSINDYLRSEMLQNEIHSLNNEISLLLNRVKLEEQRSRDLSTQLKIAEEKNVELQDQLSELVSKRTFNKEASESIFDNNDCDKHFLMKGGVEDKNSETNVHEHYDMQIKELLQEKSTLKDTLREKEDEIILLKSRLSQKTYCFSADELQSRLRALTITLVEKQSALESLTQEKNNLLNKLNHLQKRYDEALGILQQSRINMNDTDDVKARVPIYNTNGTFRQHVGKLYSILLSFGGRNRLSLRGISTWKLSLIIYIIFMHGLVFLLLYSHMPDSTDVRTKD